MDSVFQDETRTVPLPITLLTAEPGSRWHDGFDAWVVSLRNEPLPTLPLPDTVILDTDGLSTLHLARLLHHLRSTPFVALIHPLAYGQHLLAALAPALFAVIAPSLAPMALAAILRLLDDDGRVARPLWCGITPPPRLLPDPDLLPILAAMEQAPTITMVARATSFTRRSLHRKLAAARAALDLPPGAVSQFAPPDLAARLVTVLDDPERMHRLFAQYKAQENTTHAA
jgi:hypothetical protein